MNVWNRRWTACRWRQALKLALVAAVVPIVRAAGKLPARRLGLGTMDEPLEYWRSMERTAFGNRWCSRDGVDYAAALSRLRVPLLHVLSDGDRLFCQPDDALLFTAALKDRRTVWRLGSRCQVAALRGLAPGHVAMVRDPQCEPLWRHVAQWLLAQQAP